MSTTPPPVPPVPPVHENESNSAATTESFTPNPASATDYAAPYFNYIRESRYSLRSVVSQLFILLVISVVVAIVGYCIDSLAESRHAAELLSSASCDMVVNSTSYCFALTIITLSTLLLMDLRFRKPINNVQYVLIGAALFCFYLLMLSFAEQMVFAAAFGLSSLMTLILIAAFTNGLMHKAKATATVVGVLVVEYGILLGLLYIGSFALLAGSLILFALIALAMFFTLRLKIVDNELYIGNPNE